MTPEARRPIMVHRRTRPLAWYERLVFRILSGACLVLAWFALSPIFSFEHGVDVSFHFSNLVTFLCAILFVPLLIGLNWLFETFASTRIDIEREARDKAFQKAFSSSAQDEAIRRFAPEPKGRAET